MRTFKYKQNQANESSSLDINNQNSKPSNIGQRSPLPLFLQRTVGNQKMLPKDERPSPRALMLLDLFIKNRERFREFYPMEYRRESKDKDASGESIQVKEGRIYYTFEFVTNNKTGFIFVRQSQDGTEIVNYYQSSQAEKAFTDAASEAIPDKDAKPAKEDEPVAETALEEAASSDEKEAPDKTPTSIDEKTPKEKPKAKNAGLPLYLRNQPVLNLSAAETFVPRTISVSGGQTITVYGTFPPVVEAALADGWLSFSEMSALWKSGKHGGEPDDSGHDMMEMLTQRALPPPKGIHKEIVRLSKSEKLSWEGTDSKGGIRSLGALSREGGKGEMVTRIEHYLTNTPMFDVFKKEARAEGVHSHVYNLQRYLNEINAETTLAPDDQTTLRRLMFLHYVMRYPSPEDRFVLLPSPTPAQISLYRKLWGRSSPDFVQLNELALEIGLPDSM